MKKMCVAGAMLFFVSQASRADKYGLDELDPSEGSSAGALVFGVGLVATVNAWHRYNKDGVSAAEVVAQAICGLAAMWLGASMK